MSETAPPDPVVPLKTPAAEARSVADVLAAARRGVDTLALLLVVIAWVLVARSAPPKNNAMLGFLALVVAAVLAVWLLNLYLRGFAALLRVLADLSDAVHRLEPGSAAGVGGRVADPTTPPAATATATATPAESRARQLAEARQAIRRGQWDDAQALIHAFADAHPDDPETARLAEELAEARKAAGAEILVKISAAREANDPDRVIDLRDEVTPLIDAEARHALDRDLAKWFLLTIHRRLRSGTMRPEVAVLAGRVAGSLDDTPEGASLRASLPTLRRAAGLCPRCAQPYKGIDNACPACLTGIPAPPVTVDTHDPDPDPDVEP